MIDTVIVSGGNIDRDFALRFLEKKKTENKKLRLIAADKGLEFFQKTGLEPDVVVGDFDSLSAEGKVFLGKLEKTRIYRLKPEKDDSDTQSAVNLAMADGAKKILILGATGSRLDHVLANLGLLSMAKSKGADIVLLDGNNYITLITSGTRLKKEEQFGRFVSFFPVGGPVTELTLKGFKYPLTGHKLTVEDSGLTVSNEIIEETAVVTFAQGSLLMIMSRD